MNQGRAHIEYGFLFKLRDTGMRIWNDVKIFVFFLAQNMYTCVHMHTCA